MVSLFLAIAIEPAVNALAQRGWRRGLATAVVFLVLFVAAAGFVVAIGWLVVDQVSNLANAIPGYVEETIAFVNRTFDTNLSSDTLVAELSSAESPVRAVRHGPCRQRPWGRGAAPLAGVPVADGGVVRGGVRRRRAALPAGRALGAGPSAASGSCCGPGTLPSSRPAAMSIRGLLLAAASTIATWAFLWLVGVPNPLALAIWVGVVSQFVPTVGTYLAGALPALVALLSSPLDAVWVVVFIAAYQQFENYLLAPRSRRHVVGPGGGVRAVIAGAALLGGVGALLALRVGRTLQAFSATYVRRHRWSTRPDRPPPEGGVRSAATAPRGRDLVVCVEL